MIDLIVVDECMRTMFTVKIQSHLAIALGDAMYPKVDENDNYIGRAVKWSAFKDVMDRAQ